MACMSHFWIAWNCGRVGNKRAPGIRYYGKTLKVALSCAEPTWAGTNGKGLFDSIYMFAWRDDHIKSFSNPAGPEWKWIIKAFPPLSTATLCECDYFCIDAVINKMKCKLFVFFKEKNNSKEGKKYTFKWLEVPVCIGGRQGCPELAVTT